MKENLYNKLLNNYNELSEDDKNNILIYQSRLFYFINEITSIPNYELLHSDEIYSCLKDKEVFEMKYVEYKEIVDKPQNLFFKMGIFQRISFENINDFIKSMLQVIQHLNNLKNKMVLEENVTLYRGTNIENLDLISLGKGDFISTSLDSEIAFEFTSGEGYPVLFKLNVNSPVSVIVSPYRIGLVYDKNISPLDAYLNNISPTTLKLVANDINQKEIVLFNDEIEYEFVSKNEIDHILVIEVNVRTKNLIPNK